MPVDTVRDTGQRRWQNWHQTVDQSLERWLVVSNADPHQSTIPGYNATTRVLQDLMGQARDKDLSIRAHGGTWSFSPIAATEGILLNTQPLNYRFRMGAEQFHPANAGGAALIFAQCGMAIVELNRYLAPLGLALQTCGASNGQTIAGAISTGTHGAALRFGAMQDYVRALHLIVSPEESVWLEPASRPAVRDELAGFVNARLIRDDELFYAALVSFGSFGLIHGVLLEAAPMYYLQSWRETRALDDTLWRAIASLDFSALTLQGAAGRQPDHFQVLINPFDQSRQGIVTAMYRVPSRPPGSTPPKTGSEWTQGDSAFEAVGLITDLLPDASALLASLIDKLTRTTVANVCGEPGQMFRDTTTRGKTAGAAVGVPLDRTRDAIEVARTEIGRTRAPALLAIRLVRSTKATLGFTSFEPATAVIDIDCPQSNRQRDLLHGLWPALEQAGIPFRFHWGKLHEIDRDRLRRMYGDRVDRWLSARRTLLPTPELRRLFANAYTDRAGLSD
ncbi:MAG TPA: FAD-binding protein [Gemmatimonadales bacterium]|nr:FAD-binding protein [Gemmatimonadales bacterium]